MLRGPDNPADPPADPPVDPPANPPAEPQKPADPSAEPSAVEPITLETLKIPEGFEVQPELATNFLEILNDDKMSPTDRANALLELHGKTLTAASEAGSEQFDQVQTEWKDAAKTELGDKLQPTLTGIGKLIGEFGDDELKGVFDLTGAGNNVHMIKFLGKIADKLTEGGYFNPKTPTQDSGPDAAAKRLFPSMKG